MKNLHGIMLILFLSFLVVACSNTASDDNRQESEQSEAQQENDEPLKEENPNQTVEPDDEQLQDDNENSEKSEFNAEEIMNEYKTAFLSLVQETENDGKLTSIQTQEQLMSYLQQNMSKDLASSYANTYFRVESDGVYMKAMDSPTWLDPSQTFEVEKLNEKEYKVIQERNNELLGHVNVTYKIIFSNTRWIVDDIQTKKVESNTKPQIDSKNNLESISKKDAIALVRDHLNLNGNNTMNVKVDHQDQDKYVVHVYEVVKQDNHSHTATLGWYYVYKSDGQIENMMQ
ncbi:hypothetical protein JOC75_002173 [Metabacillus crassostreae]|uniref:hypothetical protein n=1 Tax=Metabacillus crassostreae TaxID=929098 RepID=UPI00195E744D|nr:hypothetical protein [Metabacillus crassostreae]MBM7604200.1 hypothetical protein [Metabacillus crassostreae]